MSRGRDIADQLSATYNLYPSEYAIVCKHLEERRCASCGLRNLAETELQYPILCTNDTLYYSSGSTFSVHKVYEQKS